MTGAYELSARASLQRELRRELDGYNELIRRSREAIERSRALLRRLEPNHGVVIGDPPDDTSGPPAD